MKWLLSLPQLLALNCISIDFKAALHQRRSCDFSGFLLLPFDTSKMCEEKFFILFLCVYLDRNTEFVHTGNVCVTASEATAWLRFHYFYAGTSLSSLSAAAAACHHSNPSSFCWNLHFSSFTNFFLGLDGLVDNCARTNLRPCTNIFLKYDCRQQPAKTKEKNKQTKKTQQKNKINPVKSCKLSWAPGSWPFHQQPCWILTINTANRAGQWSINNVQSKGEGWISGVKGGNTQNVT